MKKNKKIMFIGKNGSGKTKTIGKNIFGRMLNSKEIAKLDHEGMYIDIFEMNIPKGQILYFHSIALQEELKNSEFEIFTKLIEGKQKYDLIHDLHKFANLKESLIKRHEDSFISWKEKEIREEVFKLIEEERKKNNGVNISYERNKEITDEVYSKYENINKWNDEFLDLLKKEKLLIKLSFFPSSLNEEISNIIWSKIIKEKTFENIKIEWLIAKCLLLIDEFEINTQSSISEIKEYFYREIIKNILNEYKDSTWPSIDKLENDAIKRFNDLCNISDIKTKIKIIKNNEKVFLKFLNEDDAEVIFKNLSTGQKTLLNLISQITIHELNIKKKTTCLILEEFDAFLNPENISELIPLINNIDCNILMTSHNPLTVSKFHDSPITNFYKIEEDNVKEITQIESQRFLLSKSKDISLISFKIKTVFVEDKTDAMFYRNHYSENNIDSDYLLDFQPISPNKGDGGVSKIEHLYRSLNKEGQHPKNIIYIIDRDTRQDKENKPREMNLNNERYSLENFLYDPFFLCENNIINKKDNEWEEVFKNEFSSTKIISSSFIIEGKEKTYEISSEFLNTNLKNKESKWISYINEKYGFKNGIDIIQKTKNNKILFKSVLELLENCHK